MRLLTTEHLTKIINKVKSLVFGTNNIEDGAITKAKIDPDFITEINAAQTDNSSLKNIIIYIPDGTELVPLSTYNVTNNAGFYVPDYEAMVGDYNFICKLTQADIANISFNGCTIALVEGNNAIGNYIYRFIVNKTVINNSNDKQTCNLYGNFIIFNKIAECHLYIEFNNITNDYIINITNKFLNTSPIHVKND